MLDSARRALLLRAGGGAPDRWLRRRYYVALALLLLLGVAASEPFGHREGAAVPIVDDAAVSTLSTRRPLATPAATMDWDMVDARDAVQALAAHFGFDFAVAVDFLLALQRAEHGGGGGALAAVHRLDMTCACDIWRGGGARAGIHHCGLEWWYGKSSGGKVWQRGVSGCVKGCVLENVNGEDNCFSVARGASTAHWGRRDFHFEKYLDANSYTVVRLLPKNRAPTSGSAPVPAPRGLSVPGKAAYKKLPVVEQGRIRVKNLVAVSAALGAAGCAHHVNEGTLLGLVRNRALIHPPRLGRRPCRVWVHRRCQPPHRAGEA